jgi:hypothetical protein
VQKQQQKTFFSLLQYLGPTICSIILNGLSVNCSRPTGLGSYGFVFGELRPLPAGRALICSSGTSCIESSTLP